MADTLHNNVLDAALDEIATATQMDVTSDSSTPTDLTNSLGSVAMTAGDGNGDYTVAEGDTSGRKLTVAEQSVSVTTAGTAKHVVLSLDGTILATATCTDQAVTVGGTMTVPAFDIEIAVSS